MDLSEIYSPFASCHLANVYQNQQPNFKIIPSFPTNLSPTNVQTSPYTAEIILPNAIKNPETILPVGTLIRLSGNILSSTGDTAVPIAVTTVPSHACQSEPILSNTVAPSEQTISDDSSVSNFVNTLQMIALTNLLRNISPTNGDANEIIVPIHINAPC